MVDNTDDSKMPTSNKSPSSFAYSTLYFVIHVLTILVYILPVTYTSDLVYNPTPQLDEIHLHQNNDINPSNGKLLSLEALKTILTNDYWGRNMNSPSSHKSYRPCTILSFRLFQQFKLGKWHPLFTQRLVNILLHSALADMVSRLSLILFSSFSFMKWTTNHSSSSPQVQKLFIQSIVKLLVALHPTHIETVVNAANRAHLLSLCLCVLELDLDIPIYCIGLIHIFALTSCETAVFLLPAICLTWLWIWIIKHTNTKPMIGATRNKSQTTDNDTSKNFNTLLLQGIKELSPRICLVTTITLSYLAIRHKLDWLSIPDGLIRPAENPYYTLVGLERVLSYSYVFALHVSKALGMGLTDWIGFSHEYGFDCIPKITSWTDERLIVPMLMISFSIYLLFIKVRSGNHKDTFIVIVAYSWIATLFPISGLVKVGTFVSDRLALPSSLLGCILWARMLTKWVLVSPSHNTRKKRILQQMKRVTVLLLFLSYSCLKVHRRSIEWMHSTTLLESSLRACPRSAKSNLEMSKIYSGLFPDKLDLDKALQYLQTAEDIDPKFCDVHFQYALIYQKQNKVIEFENHLTQSLLCPYNTSISLSIWQQYWKNVMNDPNPNSPDRQRYNKHLATITAEQEKLRQQEQAKTSFDGYNKHHDKDEF